MANDKDSRWEEFWMSITFGRIAHVVLLVLLALLVYSIWINGPGFLGGLGDWFDQSSDIDFIRGIITFMFVLATVIIAVALTYFSLFYRRGTAEDKEDFKNRFSGGKEVLAILIGIVGTIMGFYYGNGKVTPKDVTTIQQSNPQESSGATATGAIEIKAFDLLIKKNYDDAVKAFDLLSKATPPSPNAANIDSINKLLLDAKNAERLTSPDESTKNTAWADLYCKIFTGKMATNMSKETRDKFESGCNATAKGSTPTPTPKPKPSSTG